MMKIKIQFTGPCWTKQLQSGIQWRGAIFTDGVMHRTPEEIAKWLPRSGQDARAWSDVISKFNGFFALVWQAEGQVVAVVDRIRSIPLFYGKNSGVIFISDDAEWIRQQVGDEIMDPVAREEFQLACYVTGKETLYPNVKQLQAGELLIIDETKAMPTLVTHRYYRFVHTEPHVYDEGVLRQGLENSAIASVKRLIDYADGRQIVIPLSGGYDSRLIATLLCKLDYKNILTFSYGIKGNKESAYSRQVAEALGLPWYFVEYSNEQWRIAWNTDQCRQYQKWASGLVSLPHLQDWAAVRALQSNEAIEKGCVFVPGHSGDFISGSHIPNEAFLDYLVNIEILINKILQTHYSKSARDSGPQEKFNIWKERVIDRTEVQKICLQTDLASAFEKWDWQERQAKFIVNSVRVYEFFGYDWWLPFWDSDFMEFWQGVPLNFRKGRYWYLEYVKRTYASQIGVDVKNSLDNAEDFGIFEKSIRLTIAMFPACVKDYIKALRYVITPKRIPNMVHVSHLPASEITRLQSEGYGLDGMLADEFLGLLNRD